MPTYRKLVTTFALMVFGGCTPIEPRESGGFMGDTLMRVCVYTTRACEVEIISQPGRRTVLKQQVKQATVLRKLNPPINFAQEVQVFADCGSGAVMVARSTMPSPLAGGMCLMVEL